MSRIVIGHANTNASCPSEETSLPVSSSGDLPSARPSRRAMRRFAADWGYRVIVVALVAWNAWWLGRDYWPIPDIKSVEQRIARGQHEDAMRALRAHLRRSPRDGQARMLLARSLAARGDLKGCANELHRVPNWWPSKREALYLEGESYLSVGSGPRCGSRVAGLPRGRPAPPGGATSPPGGGRESDQAVRSARAMGRGQ